MVFLATFRQNFIQFSGHTANAKHCLQTMEKEIMETNKTLSYERKESDDKEVFEIENDQVSRL